MEIGIRRLSFVLAFWARIMYASTFGGSQNAMAVMWEDKHHVGAARGKMLGEYSRANKCWSMFFPAMIASWQEEDVQCASVSGSLWGVGSMIHQDSSGPASRTWSNN